MADADSLILFIDNTKPLYDQLKAVERSMIKRIVGGTYDAKRAPKAFSYLTEEAAKRYVHELGDSEELPSSWHVAFPKKVRDEADKDLAQRFWERAQHDPHYIQEITHARAAKKPRRR